MKVTIQTFAIFFLSILYLFLAHQGYYVQVLSFAGAFCLGMSLIMFIVDIND